MCNIKNHYWSYFICLVRICSNDVNYAFNFGGNIENLGKLLLDLIELFLANIIIIEMVVYSSGGNNI